MIETVANRAAGWIHRHSPDSTASQEVLTYALSIYFNAFSIVSLSLLIGFFAGTFIETVVVIVAFSVLRAFSGGNHMRTPMMCLLVSVAAFTSIPHVPAPEPWLRDALLCVSLLLALLFAPNVRHDPIYGNKLLPYMKWIAVAIVGTNFLIASWVVTLAFFIQCITLIPLQRRCMK
ncbi:accessory gene regulator ArgB-like protein [Paenibacillus antri]|nr:accessory gene regulator B family protein [Paenibacillus antri]